MTYGSYPPPLPRPLAPPPRGRNIALIAIACGLAVALLVVVVVVLNRKPPVPVVETKEQKYRETSDAFSTTVADSPVEKAAIQKSLENLFGAIKASNASAVTNCFDADRMLEEVESKGLMPKFR